MKIEYRGINPEQDRNYREAYVLYNEEIEQEKANKILGLLGCMGWKIEEEEGCACVRVADKEEYEMLLADYKKAKKMV